MKIKTIIVEDEQPSLGRMKKLLTSFDEIDLIGVAEDGQAAIRLIDETKPRLAFLDIQLPVFSAFEVLKQVRHHPKVIFVTAYDEFAVKAFEENAVDYILKPTSEARLRKAIDRVCDEPTRLDSQLIELLKGAVDNAKFISRFSVRIGNEILFILEKDVHWFYAEDKYVFLKTATKNYIYDMTLRELEANLDPDKFIRIHKGIIIAVVHIQKVERSFRGRYRIRMNDQNKTTFDIGRTYLPNVREKLQF